LVFSFCPRSPHSEREDLFWPAADLPSNLEPRKTQGSAQPYGIAKIRVSMFDAIISHRWQRPAPGNVVD
jgi:hypothetical protein